MPRSRQSKGRCAYCEVVIVRNGICKHLSVCQKRQTVIEKAQAIEKVESEALYHLRVQDAYRSEFWLDLEMRGLRTLKDLDAYLRGIWLECCGHMSRFSIGGWQGREIPTSRRVEEVFKEANELMHIYDFGTSSQTLIRVVGTREGKPTTTRPIVLMARNLMPEAECVECKQPAAWLCEECLIEKDVWGTLCDTHAKNHPHDNYGEPIRLVNSPRMGMCGYQGPAEPPY